MRCQAGRCLSESSQAPTCPEELFPVGRLSREEHFPADLVPGKRSLAAPMVLVRLLLTGLAAQTRA